MLKEFTVKDVKNVFQSGKLELKPTQNKLSLPIINRICKKMFLGYETKAIHVDDNCIVNGHHRYISSKLINSHLKSINWKKANSTQIHIWSNLIIESQDWDTSKDSTVCKIKEHIKDDLVLNPQPNYTYIYVENFIFNKKINYKYSLKVFFHKSRVYWHKIKKKS